MKKPWPATLVAAALLLSACGAGADPAEPEEAKAPTQAATSPAEAATDEAIGDGEGAEWDSWGDGVWPEGYSFELPEYVGLQDELIDPMVEGVALDEGLPYRRMTISGDRLSAAPDEVWMSGMDPTDIREGLLFAGAFMIEHVMDSPALFQEYDSGAERQWLESVDRHLSGGLVEHVTENWTPYGDERAWAIPVTIGMLIVEDGRDSEDEVQRASVSRALHEEGGSRSANVQITLADASAVPDSRMLELVYETSQAFLFVGIAEGEDEEKVYGLTLETKYELDIHHDEASWKVWDLSPSFSWTWDHDIEAAA